MDRRAKFAHDPNNLWWSRSDTRYGHRILQSQGWQPGDFLGAKDAPHAKFYSAANASHIRVALRDDNLGLGARYGAAGGEWESTGLDGFQDLLGRLNGLAPQELENKQQARATLKRNRYAEKRWGSLNFVSGGLLVGDKIGEAKVSADDPQLSRQEPKSQLNDFSEHVSEIASSRIQPSCKSAGELEEPEKEPFSSVDSLSKMSNNKTLSRKDMTARISKSNINAGAATITGKFKHKLKRKEKAITVDVELESRSPSLNPSAPAVSMDVDGADTRSLNANSTGKQTAPLHHTIPYNARHAGRQRQIKHKKMAMMDRQALNEVSLPVVCVPRRRLFGG